MATRELLAALRGSNSATSSSSLCIHQWQIHPSPPFSPCPPSNKTAGRLTYSVEGVQSQHAVALLYNLVQASLTEPILEEDALAAFGVVCSSSSGGGVGLRKEKPGGSVDLLLSSVNESRGSEASIV